MMQMLNMMQKLNMTISQDIFETFTDPTFVTFRLVCVVPSPYKLSGSSIINGNACFYCSAKQLRGAKTWVTLTKEC